MRMTSLIKTGDLRIASASDFNSTTVEILPVTEKGKAWFSDQYGDCAVSVTVRKASLID